MKLVWSCASLSVDGSIFIVLQSFISVWYNSGSDVFVGGVAAVLWLS